MVTEIREIPVDSGKFYEVELDDAGVIIKPPKFIEPKLTSIELDELTASKLFLKYSNEIQAWINTSPRGDVLRAILGRQGSVVDKESLELLKTIVEEERDNMDVTTDATMIAEVIGLLDALISGL
jgi:hypothetical protein